jgi:hypothetical protein
MGFEKLSLGVLYTHRRGSGGVYPNFEYVAIAENQP